MKLDFTVPRESTTLVKPSKPDFFPRVNIDLQNLQLKHRISTRDADTIYYCSGREIYALHLDSQKRELVKSLSWELKCLDAAYGWICAAADEGKCFFINIAGDHNGQFQAGSHHRRAEVDELLPLDLDPASRSLTNREQQYSTSTTSRTSKYVLHSHVLGSLIVNSVTIHKMKSLGSGFEDEVVVLLTYVESGFLAKCNVDVFRNNDETVRIFSLSQSKELVTLTYPIAMNHATISPDGNLLLAVGDTGQAFFHRRVPFENSATVGGKVFSTCGWIAVAEPLLPQTALNDQLFCTAFSPSGHRCVVASEGGIITVFDTSLITSEMEKEDAVICVMRTSRLSTSPRFIGAARSMSFSPSPWDLLVVAEDQGRVLVLDTRGPEFMFRQTLELSTDPSDVVTTNFTEIQDTLQQRQLDIEARFLQSHREAMESQLRLATMTNTANHLEAASDSMLTGDARTLAESDDSLTGNQLGMVESIGSRYARVHDAIASHSATSPTNVNHTSSLSSDRNNTGHVPSADTHLNAVSARAPFAREHADAHPTNTDNLSHSAFLANPALTDRDHQMAQTASIAEYMHQRNIDRERQRTSDRQPRRRSSVVISSSSSRSARNNPPTLAPIGTSTPTFSTSPSRLPSSTSISSSAASLTNRNDTNYPSRLASSLTQPEHWPTPDDWRTASIAAMSAASNDDQTSRTLAEGLAILSRPRREAGIPNHYHPTSEPWPMRGGASTAASTAASLTSATDARTYQQTMQSLIARTETTRAELARNEALLARNRLGGELDGARARMEGLDRRIRDVGGQSLAGDVAVVSRSLVGSQSHAGGVVVQGVGWSPDGRSLFVATERGLLQYQVNIRERMQWPSAALL